MPTSNGGAAAAGPVEPTDGAEATSHAAQTSATRQQGARLRRGILSRSHTTGATPSQARAWRGMSYLRRGCHPNPCRRTADDAMIDGTLVSHQRVVAFFRSNGNDSVAGGLEIVRQADGQGSRARP